jgi:hypothetical protein
MGQDVTHPAGSICHPSIRLHNPRILVRGEAGEGLFRGGADRGLAEHLGGGVGDGGAFEEVGVLGAEEAHGVGEGEGAIDFGAQQLGQLAPQRDRLQRERVAARTASISDNYYRRSCRACPWCCGSTCISRYRSPCFACVENNGYYRADQYCIHHQARGQTFMPCRPQRRQRHIWAYQPAPNSSKPSCAVSSPQSGQKRRSRSGPSPERVALRRARSDPDDQSPSAANKPCKRFGRIPPTGPLRCCIGARPTRARI